MAENESSPPATEGPLTTDHPSANGDTAEPTAADRHAGGAAADAAATVLDFSALLLGELGHADGEFTSLGYKVGAGKFRTAVMRPGNAVAAINQLPAGADIYFGVNPVRGPARKNAGRGGADQVTRLAALWVDLDVKPGACTDLDHAVLIVDDLAVILDSRPSAIVRTGHGLHAYWPVDDTDPTGAAALLGRWKQLVTTVAAKRGAAVDAVFDLPRMLRVPGTHNHKEV